MSMSRLNQTVIVVIVMVEVYVCQHFDEVNWREFVSDLIVINFALQKEQCMKWCILKENMAFRMHHHGVQRK